MTLPSRGRKGAERQSAALALTTPLPSRPGRLPVDISINQSNGISAGKIVNAYISALPALRPLVLVVKAFLNQRGMNEVYSGGLGSYSVICLVISFLQVRPPTPLV